MAVVYPLSLSVAAKHDSRNIKINLKLILGFLDCCCHVSRLPGNTISGLYRGCRKAPQQVEIRLPRRRDTHAIIRSLHITYFKLLKLCEAPQVAERSHRTLPLTSVQNNTFGMCIKEVFKEPFGK